MISLKLAAVTSPPNARQRACGHASFSCVTTSGGSGSGTGRNSASSLGPQAVATLKTVATLSACPRVTPRQPERSQTMGSTLDARSQTMRATLGMVCANSCCSWFTMACMCARSPMFACSSRFTPRNRSSRNFLSPPAVCALNCLFSFCSRLISSPASPSPPLQIYHEPATAANTRSYHQSVDNDRGTSSGASRGALRERTRNLPKERRSPPAAP
eukprot:COSAG01_NODE_9367_length_2467_cov_4.648649_2_plen_215_part_00